MSQFYDANGNPAFTDVVTQNASLNVNGATSVTQLRGQSVIGIQLTGTWTATIQFEATIDGTNFFALLAYPTAGGAPVTSTAANGQWVAECAGYYQVRLRVSAFAAGPALASSIASQGGDIPNAISTTGSVREDLISVAGTALGTPVAFGTSPGAVVAESVNSSAFIGTTAAVAAAAGIQKVGISGNAGASVDAVAGAAAPANVLYIAGRSATANPVSEVTGDSTPVMVDKAGRVVTTAGNIRELVAAQTTVIAASTVETTIITAGGAGVFNDLSLLVITTTAVTASVITIKDATAGTTRLTLHLPATAAKDGPIVIPFPVPLAQATANANWTATCSVNTTAFAFSAVFVKNL